MDLSGTGLSESGQEIEVKWAKPPNAIPFNQRKYSYINDNNIGENIDFANLSISTSPSNSCSPLNPLATPFNPDPQLLEIIGNYCKYV